MALNGIESSENSEITKDQSKIPKEYILCLKKRFGLKKFREMQWNIIASILLDRRDNCAIMATGYGKSLCYQFPSVYLNTITIVVSPLISLMQDQVLALGLKNLRACFLGSAQENRETQKEVIDGQHNIVYVTPEYITAESGEFLLKRIGDSLTLIAIDEAHCISEWGHDFRAAYRDLSRLRELCPTVPILAMTATATPRVRDDIIQNLKLNNAQIISTGFDRPNLEFSVKLKSNSKIWNDIGPHICENVKAGSIIVYCISKRVTEKVAYVIKSNGHPCDVYHAGLPTDQRKKTHEDFIHNRVRIVCATIAFGMGIDKPDVRLVIHYGAAKDVESYYQQVGRAGRDGKPSKCVMFYQDFDWIIQGNLKMNCNRDETREQMENLMEVMCKYVSSNECRRRFILSYFGEDCDNLAPRPNCCDNCKRQITSSTSPVNLFNKYEGLEENGLLDITDEAMKILTFVRDNLGTFGLNKVLLILKGSASKLVPEQCFRAPLYGSIKGKTMKWLQAVGRYLHKAEMLVTAQPKRTNKLQRILPTCAITSKGRLQLRNRSPIKIVPEDDFICLLKPKVDKPTTKENKTLTSGEMASGSRVSASDHQESKSKPHPIVSDSSDQPSTSKKIQKVLAAQGDGNKPTIKKTAESQDLNSESQNDELNLLMAELQIDAEEVTTTTENDENEKTNRHGVKGKQNSNKKQTEMNSESDSEEDANDEYWDSDVTDLDLSRVAEKAEREIVNLKSTP